MVPTFAWEDDMKRVAIVIIVLSAAVVPMFTPAQAFDLHPAGFEFFSVGCPHGGKPVLGDPFYAGPNVIVIRGSMQGAKPGSYGRIGCGVRHYLPHTRHRSQQRLPRYEYSHCGFSNRYPHVQNGLSILYPARLYTNSHRPHGRER